MNIFKRLISFGLVGSLGLITNLIIFYIIADRYMLDKNIAAIICFIIAVSQNYIINTLWTYKGASLTFVRYVKFVSVSLVGLLINLIVLNLLLTVFPNIPYKTIPQGIGILTAFLINFTASHLFVFSKKL
ncbi:MAG: GtrA family protein [Spirochaetaceae bacterium]